MPYRKANVKPKVKTFFLAVILFVIIPIASHAAFGDVSTFVSRPYYGDGKGATRAFFDFPADLDVNKKGGFVIADTNNNVIRRIKAKSRKVKTVAGTASYGYKDGAASEAEFAQPKGVDMANKVVYVADTGNNRIRKIKEGRVTTLVADLNAPEGVKVYGETLYFLDTGNGALKKIGVNGGSVSTITSDLNEPKKLDISEDGTIAYIADGGSHQVRKVDLGSGVVTTVAGSGEEGMQDGVCEEAKFDQLWGVHIYDAHTLYVSDGDGYTDYVRKIDLDNCSVSTIASDPNMRFINAPQGLTSYNGKLFVLSTGIALIEKFDITDPTTHSKFAGAKHFNVRDNKPVLVGQPKFLALSPNKKTIYFSENNRIRKMRRADQKHSSVVAGSIIDNYNDGHGGDTVAHVGEDARFSDVSSFAVSNDGEKIYAVDRNNNRIREVTIDTQEVRYLTGAGGKNLAGSQENGYADGHACPDEYDTGVEGCAYFSRPQGSVLSKDGKILYVSDTGNNRIRAVVLKGEHKGKVTTLAGSGEAGYKNGTGTDASFNAPIGLARSKKGNSLYVADRNNHVIRKIKIKTGEVTTLVGTGASGYLDGEIDKAVLSYPEWITRGSHGRLYISDVGSHRVRVIDRKEGVVKLVAGSGHRGYYNGAQKNARFNNLKGLVELDENTLLVAELYNDVIRKIDITGEVPFTDPAPTLSSFSPQVLAKEWFTDPSVFSGIEIHGTNFRYGAVTYVGEHKATKTYVDSANGKIVADIPIENMSPGYYTVRVVNSDGQSAEKFRAIAVSENGTVPMVDYYPPKQ